MLDASSSSPVPCLTQPSPLSEIGIQSEPYALGLVSMPPRTTSVQSTLVLGGHEGRRNGQDDNMYLLVILARTYSLRALRVGTPLISCESDWPGPEGAPESPLTFGHSELCTEDCARPGEK